MLGKNKLVTEQQMKDILQEIANTENEMELASIIHASPSWGYMSEEYIKLFHKSFEKRGQYLKEQRRIANMSLKERASYILTYCKYPEKQALVDFANNIQTNVQLAILNENFDLPLQELKFKALKSAAYLRQHVWEKDAVYSFHMEIAYRLDPLIINYECDKVNYLLNSQSLTQEQKVTELFDLVKSLRKEKFEAKQYYGAQSEYVGTLRKCCENAAGGLKIAQKDVVEHQMMLNCFRPSMLVQDNHVEESWLSIKVKKEIQCKL